MSPKSYQSLLGLTPLKLQDSVMTKKIITDNDNIEFCLIQYSAVHNIAF